LPSARTSDVHIHPSKPIHEWLSIPRSVKNRATCRYGRVAVLADLNLILSRRVHVIRIVASRSNILRAIEHPAVLLDKPEVLGSEALKCRRVLPLYCACPLVFDRQNLRSHARSVSRFRARAQPWVTKTAAMSIFPVAEIPLISSPAPGLDAPNENQAGWGRARRSSMSLTDITCAVEAARITSVAWWTSAAGIAPNPRSG
jgi:hypothetical protein